MSDLLKNLNPQQQKAVKHKEGPLLIMAGAGSGKTRALTVRAAYLISQHDVDPHRILLTTFTNKAANEMQERLKHLVGITLPFAGTFHSLCARLLRLHGQHIGLSQNFLIYDQSDQLATIKRAFKLRNISTKDHNPRAVMAAIESAKHELITPSEYTDIARGPFQKVTSKIYQQYQILLKEYQALDFNDLLTYTVTLFETQEHIRQKYQDQFLHVLIDEYQDTNKAQYRLSKLLSHKHQNLCVVGDASQAIYSWRGADYRNLVMLQQDYPTLTTIKLEQNYRSTQNILYAADHVIKHNTLHPVLELWTDTDPGEKISIYQAKDEYDEAAYITNLVTTNTTSLSDVAILYRTNAQSRVLEEALIRKGIPYTLIGGVKFYDRKEIKDVLAYIRYFYNPLDQISFERLQKIGKRRFKAFTQWQQKKLERKKPIDILDGILKATTYLDKYDQKDPQDASRIENVKELRSLAQEFDSLEDFLENIALVEQESLNQQDQDQNALTLMTLHAAKGLEFDTVCIIGLEEGLFPHSRSLLDKHQLEEERRLAYVGITRAKKKLHCIYAKSRMLYGSRSQNKPSRFLDEFPTSVVDRINQPDAGMPTKNKNTSLTSVQSDTLEKFLNDEIDIEEFLTS